MQLVSAEFFGFFLAVFCLHWLLPQNRRVLLLIFASYVFYAWRDWRYAGLLLFMTCASYFLGKAIQENRGWLMRRFLAIVSVFLFVGILAYFKLRTLESALPLGISYYTFQCLGYVLDVARGIPAASGFLPYCLFVSFFPQITAGPIGRARNLLPQMTEGRIFDRVRFFEGCHLIYWGLFQKIFVADNLSPLVISVFDSREPQSGLSALLGIYAFTLQLYGDFGGYSNIARGLGKCLGLELAENFRLPFLAQDMLDHWKRWHISLSEWFSDFLYRPLVDLPVGFYKFYAAPIATMLVMGLWHRFSAQMLILGLYYGLGISVTLLVKSWIFRQHFSPSRAASMAIPWFNRILTFHLVCGGFLLLRAQSLEQAAELGKSVFADFRLTDQAGDILRHLIFFAGPMLVFDLIEHLRGGAGSLQRLPLPIKGIIYAEMFLLMLIFSRSRSESFFYSVF